MILGKLHSYFKRKSLPQISVIMPIYNTEKYLRAALTSVLENSFEQIEIICVDDCSSDGSLDILQELRRVDDRVKIYRQQRRMGAGQARNRGIEVAVGTYVRFMDSDDLLPRESLETLRRLALSSGVKLVRGAISSFGNDTEGDASLLDAPPRRIRYAFGEEPLLWKPWWHTTYLMARSLLIEKNIRFPEITDGEDPVFLASVLCKANLLSSTDDVVYKYRRHPGQRRNNAAYMEHLALVRHIFLRHEPRAWFEGYGRYARDIDIPSRLQEPTITPEEALMMTARITELMDSKQVHPRSV